MTAAASPTLHPTDRPTRDLGDELLIFDADGDQLHVLNETAREIFLLCDGARTETEIVESICRTYEVDAETARTDLLQTVDQLIQLGVLERR